MASVTEIVDYVNLFQGASDSQLKGETSPMYMYNEGAAARIKRYLPDVKLIAILRHPVDRLYSRYLHLAREDRLPTKQFSDALDKSTIWWQRGDLVHEGFFGQHLERYYRLFDSSQIRVCFFDQLSRNPQSLLDDIFAFLEVDPCGTIKHDIVYNKSGLKKSRLYDRILGHKSILKTTAKKIFPSIYSKAKQSAPLLRLVTAVQDANLAHPRLDPALRLEMIDKIYREDILKLQKLLSIDFSDWLK